MNGKTGGGWRGTTLVREGEGGREGGRGRAREGETESEVGMYIGLYAVQQVPLVYWNERTGVSKTLPGGRRLCVTRCRGAVGRCRGAVRRCRGTAPLCA